MKNSASDLQKQGTTKGLEDILSMLLCDPKLFSELRQSSVPDLLEKLNSEDLDDTAKRVFRGLVISMRLNALPCISRTTTHREFDDQEIADAIFMMKFGVSTEDIATLKWISKGLTNAQIRDLAGISDEGAAMRVKRILRKLDVTNRVQAAVLAVRERIA